MLRLQELLPLALLLDSVMVVVPHMPVHQQVSRGTNARSFALICQQHRQQQLSFESTLLIRYCHIVRFTANVVSYSLNLEIESRDRERV